MLKNKAFFCVLFSGILVNSIALASGVATNPNPQRFEDLSTNKGSGFYIGIQAGIANVDEGNGLDDYVDSVYNYYASLSNATAVTKKSDQDSFGGHAFIGWSFNPYFALELGGSFLPDNEYQVLGNSTTGHKWDADLELETYDLDLMARLSLPLGDAWTIYARGGAAYEHVKLTDDATGGVQYDQTNTGLRPIYGLGIAYHLTKNISFDASWTEILGKDKLGFVKIDNPPTFGITNVDGVLPSVDLFALGVVYLFPNL